ncbi:hypothetical protein [Streptomyces benahoarensis]|uniref:Immunity protein 35 domain-containing protein n=1 Tax=Streptomyces benahoarensis TaxID=2595054 RepID=A0A553YV96_9ACTN|nr:hypothetical protein [Streptomyces benahoarensis]TSB18071.1 hypothetical protein FNJ62_25295 [Streptomyces benahoarensis]TSB33132.1 hypothetical protein FNZ23_24160 [Streptomyces benahoarensis]
MPQHADTPPTTSEEALGLVRSRYAEPRLPDGTPVPLAVEEFDIGYLVYPLFPRVSRTDSAGNPLPAPPGGAKIVVSKATGESVTVPNLPTESAIALYREQNQ